MARCTPKYLKEDALSEECKDIMASSPREEGFVATHLYKYQGFWLAPRLLQGLISSRNNFQSKDSDIFLVSTPKSGTTWLKAIVFSVVHRRRFPTGAGATPGIRHPLLTTNPHELVPFLEISLYAETDTPDLSSYDSHYRRLFGTHLPSASLPSSVRDSDCKVVYLCRNPRDTFVSLWHFANKLRPQHLEKISLDDAFDRFCRGVTLYGPFWDHVLDYWKESLRRPEKFLFLKYEEMKEEPGFHLKRLAEFLGCPFTVEEDENGAVDEILKLCSFDHLTNLEVNRRGKLSSGEETNTFFRKGEVGDWKNHLTAEMVNKLDVISELKFLGSGLEL